jgi:hypothetical protein
MPSRKVAYVFVPADMYVTDRGIFLTGSTKVMTSEA